MDSAPFIWISPFGLGDDSVYRNAGFLPVHGGPGDVDDLLSKSATRIPKPAALFIGEYVPHPIAIARHAHRLNPHCPIVFVMEQRQAEDALKKELSFVSLVGEYRTIAPSDTAGQIRILEDCRKTLARREQMRTTLDKMKVQLSSRKEGDATLSPRKHPEPEPPA